MKFNYLLAAKTGLPAEILPASYQILGHVLLLKLLHSAAIRQRRKIGAAILKIFPYIQTVCLQKGVAGEFRKPNIEIIAGLKLTETIHTELGCSFKLDVSKIMWSKGNHEERKRMIKIVKEGETIVDMFAGIGYWTIPIAKHAKAKQIFAIEKNKVAFDYLKENLRINRIANVFPIYGDCRAAVKDLPKADRIIMGYFPDTIKFFPYALKISKKGTIIHLHELATDLSKLKKEILKFKNLKIQNTRIIKEYSPAKKHYVIDLLRV